MFGTHYNKLQHPATLCNNLQLMSTCIGVLEQQLSSEIFKTQEFLIRLLTFQLTVYKVTADPTFGKK